VNHRERLTRLRRLQQVLDNAFRVPGTGLRFGWDPIIGLIPGAGDTVAALFACLFVVQAYQMRVPKVIQLRIVLNILIDVVIGMVPLAGDIGDFFWKASTKNLALLERHADEVQPARAGDWLFVLGILAIVLLAAALPFVALYWFVRLITPYA
jgi:hypothetical protein